MIDLKSSQQTCSTLEAAQEMGLAVRSVQLMVDRGELDAWKTPGGHRRISRESVTRWMQKSGKQIAVQSPHVVDVAPKKDSTGKVLLIEDSTHFQNLVSLVVRQTIPSAEFYVAGDGVSGLALYGQIQPDVLLVDILLPGIDGGALISSLRTSPQFNRSSLIVVTSLEKEERAPYAFALEGIPVVQKTRLAMELPDLLLRAYAAAQSVATS